MCTCRSASITSASLLPPPAAPPYSASGSGRLINSACRGWGRQTTGTLACTMLMVLPPPSAAAPRRTPLLLPVPLIVQGLGYTGQILEHRRGLLEVFHGACSRCAFLFAAFCRAFSSRTCCASRVLRVSVARLRLASLWPVLSAPWCWVSAPFRPGVLGYGKRIPLVLLSQQCALLQGHSVYFKFKNPIRILLSLVIHRCFVSFQKQCFFPIKICGRPAENLQSHTHLRFLDRK